MLSGGMNRATFLRLDLSESVMAAPPHVRETILRLIESDRFSAYPDDLLIYLLLADYVGLPTSNLLVTNGSDHAIQLILRAFLSPGDQLQVIDPHFRSMPTLPGPWVPAYGTCRWKAIFRSVPNTLSRHWPSGLVCVS